jgi:hypothetical protein
MAYPFAPAKNGKVSDIKRCKEIDVDKNKGIKRQTQDDRKVTCKTTGSKTLKS